MADVQSSLKNWSTVVSSNAPTTATTIGSGLAPNFQQIQATLRNELGTRSTSITAASSSDIGVKDEGVVLITNAAGTVAITSFGTVSSGIRKLVTFVVSAGSLSLVHNATSMILPSSANITVVTGDSLIAESLGSGNWKIHSYFKQDGTAVTGFNGGTVTNDIIVPDEAYGVAWDANLEVPTKNAVYDKIETLVSLTGNQNIAGNKTFSGDVKINGAGILGYTTGSGGDVTQATSKSTAVTLDKSNGRITMNAAALAANTTVSFTLNNSLLLNSDLMVLNHKGGGTVGNYNTWVQTNTGLAVIYVRNITAGSLSDALVLQFAVITGVLA